MIQWNEETLENENSVAQILMLADKEWNARKQLYERIRRKTDNSIYINKKEKLWLKRLLCARNRT